MEGLTIVILCRPAPTTIQLQQMRMLIITAVVEAMAMVGRAAIINRAAQRIITVIEIIIIIIMIIGRRHTEGGAGAGMTGITTVPITGIITVRHTEGVDGAGGRINNFSLPDISGIFY